MAHYDYACPSCGTRFEVEHHMNEHPTVLCPNCGAVCEQVFSASAIVFKGSGFYNTDQRGSSSATPASTAGTETGGEPKASEGTGSAPSGTGTTSSSEGAAPSTGKTEPKAD